MARFNATYAITEATNWAAGQFFRFDFFRDQIGQVLEFFAQSHDHDGDAGDGGTITAADPMQLYFYGQAQEF